jgi:hypothetical protein
MRFLAVCLALALWAAVPAARAQQVTVNEFMASNQATIEDPDFDGFEDWIELHNASGADVDLSGYFLTDNLSRTDKWRIPDGTTIAAGGYLIVWADDANTGPPATTGLHANFKLSASAEAVGLFSPSGALVDTVTYGQQWTDVSFGRFPDGGAAWGFFGTPTPGAANSTPPAAGVVDGPEASHESGFYSTGQVVTLTTSDPGATVRYTLDGTLPTETSAAYTGPLTLAATTVLRAAAFAPDRVPSAPLTRTFFVGETSTVPVISLVTDPAGFFSDESGIYVEGTNGIPGRCRTTPMNWNQDWERPVQFTFFEPDGAGGFTRVLDHGAGVQIFGGCSRIYPQKSLELHARGRYGADAFEHRFFADTDVEVFDDLVLRSSAQDWWRTMFRDGMIQTLTRHMDLDGQAYRPTVVFLNGAYWGIHNLREKLNEDYVAGHYGFDDDDVEQLDAEDLVERGASAHYDALLGLLDAGSPADAARFAQIESMMDVDQYLNYQIAQIYAANADWPGNNIKLWRPRTPDGRWRWMIFDTDFGFGGNGQGLSTSNTLALATDANGPSWPNPPRSTYLFRKLLENDGFRHAFIQRMAAHMNTTFAPPRTLAVIDSLKANIAAEIPRHKARWPQSISFGSSWDALVEIMRAFATDRPARMRGFVTQYFPEVVGSAALAVSVTEGGEVRAEGVPLPRRAPEAPLATVFFRGAPLRLVAVPDEGFVFTGWSGLSAATTETVSVMVPGTAAITASFAPGTSSAPEPAAVAVTEIGAVYPNPATDAATVEIALAAPGAVSLRVVDMLGREVLTVADGPMEAGVHRLALDTRALPSGVYTLSLRAADTHATRRLVITR